jgi:hypothetical protein
MSNLLTYSQACVPEPTTVFGVTLRPFCLGAYLLLRRFNNCFGSDEPRAGLGLEGETPADAVIKDLIPAVCICSMTYEEFLRALHENIKTIKVLDEKGTLVTHEIPFDRYMADWGRYIKKGIRAGAIDSIDAYANFKKHIQDSFKVPQFWDEAKQSTGAGSGSNWAETLKYLLVSELGYTESQALNMPLAKAFADNIKFLEARGLVRLMSESEIEQADIQLKGTHGR